MFVQAEQRVPLVHPAQWINNIDLICPVAEDQICVMFQPNWEKALGPQPSYAVDMNMAGRAERPRLVWGGGCKVDLVHVPVYPSPT